jgi:hypothetical protein
MTKYTFNNEEYTLEQVQSAAEQSGVDIDTYIKEAGLTAASEESIDFEIDPDPVEKPATPVAETAPAGVEPVDTDLQLEKPLSELQEISFEEKRNLPYSVSQKLIRENKSFTLNNIKKAQQDLEVQKNKSFEQQIVELKEDIIGKGPEKFKNWSYNVFGPDGIGGLPGPSTISRFQAASTAFASAIDKLYDTEETAEKVKEEYKLLSKAQKAQKPMPSVTDEDANSVLSFLAGVVGDTTQVMQSVVPTMVAAGAGTAVAGPVGGAVAGGISTLSQIAPQFITDYNLTKAEKEYPELPEDQAIDKLIDENKAEMLVPLAGAAIASIPEYIGIRGFNNFMLKNTAGKKITEQLGRLAYTSGKEGVTEVVQLFPEAVNTSIASGKNISDAAEEALEFTKDNMVKTFVSSTVGSAAFGGLAKGGKDISSRAWRKAKSMRTAIDEGQMEGIVDEISELNVQRIEANDPLLKEAIDEKIASKTSELNGLATRAASIFDFANDKEFEQIDDLEDLKRKYISKVKDIQNKKESLSPEEYKESLDLYKEKYLDAQAKIKGVARKITEEFETAVPEDVAARTVKNANEINAAYKKDSSDKTFYDVVLPNMQDLLTSITNRKFRENPEFGEGAIKKEDFIRDLIFGTERNKASSLYGLYKSFDPTQDQLLTTWITKNLENRSKRIVDERLGKQATVGGVSIDTEQAQEIEAEEVDMPAVKGPKFTKRLGLSDEIMNKARNAAIKALSTAKDVDSKTFTTDLVNSINNEIFEDIRALVPKPKEREAFMEQFAGTIWDAIPQSSLAKATRNQTFQEWNLKSPTKEAFVDYFLGRDQEGLKASTINDRVKKQLPQYLAKAVGAEYASDLLQNDPEVRERFALTQKQEVEETAKSIVENDDSEWFDYKKFQESTEVSEDDAESQTKDWNKQLPDSEKTLIIDNKTNQEDKEIFKGWVKNVMTKYFPKEFFFIARSGHLTNSSSRMAFANKENVAQELESSKFAEDTSGVNWNLVGRIDYKGLGQQAKVYVKGLFKGKNKAEVTLSDLKKSFKKIQAQGVENMKTLKFATQQFAKMYADDKSTAKFIATWYKSASNNQNHILRFAAPLKAFSRDLSSGMREEHTMPASLVGKYLFNSILNDDVDNAFKNVEKNYFQVALAVNDDNKLKGKDFNYTSRMPKGWKFTDNTWARYFNDLVNNNNGGIDPNGIEFFETGKTVAKTFGAEATNKTPDVINAQQKVIQEKTEDNIETLIDRAIGKLEDYLGPKGALQANFAAVPINILIGGLRATKLAYRSSKNLAKALEAGYKKVQDYMSRQEWLDFAKQAVTEVKKEPTGATIALAIANENAIKNEQDRVNKLNTLNEGTAKKIRVFDFDDTVARSSSKVLYTMPDGKTGSLNATEFAAKSDDLKAKGAEFNFSQFSEVIDGKPGPLFSVAQRIAKARGNEDLYILTARPADAKFAIKEFLDALGLDFKLDNIVGLGDGSAKAKADWMLQKAEQEGFNDFYFADDAIKNVKAVKDALKTIDGKVKVQQAKLAEDNKNKSSKQINEELNKLDEQKRKEKQADGLERNFRRILNIQKQKGKRPSKWFIPSNAEDIKGLLYAFLPDGKEGVLAKKFFNSTILKPYSEGVAAGEAEILQLSKRFVELKNNSKINLEENVEGTPYTIGDAIKVYNWNKAGVEVDILKQEYLDRMIGAVEANPEAKYMAEEIADNYNIEYDKNWRSIPFNKSIYDAINKGSRTRHLETFSDNVDAIFNKDNLQEIENVFGKKYVQALRNSLKRMQTGRNRISTDAQSNNFLNWINRSVATTMFFNTRSAALQLLSSLNFIGLDNNNLFQATAALANQEQWQKDYNTLWNSDYLSNRREGAKFDVLADEIAENPDTFLNKLLKKGFLPTRYADSFAIALGGAAFYRNRANTLIKQGMTEQEAESQALKDWIAAAEESQQSSDPAKISEIQASSIGKIIYAFANTPFQYARISKRKLQDVASGRSKAKGGMNQVRKDLQSVFYYTVGQAMLFNALQGALFASFFSDDEEDKLEEKTITAIERALTSYAKSLGNPGAVVGSIYSVLAEADEQIKKKGRIDNAYKLALEATAISPPLNTKLKDIVAIGNIYKYNHKQIDQDPFEPKLDNPVLEITGNAASFAGYPLDRVIRKAQNLEAVLNEETDAWEKLFLTLGWSKWELGIDDKPKKGFDVDSKDFEIETNDFEIDTEDFEINTEDFEIEDSALNKLDNGIAGRANNDGTIEIDPNLSPVERAKTIAHEEQHMKDMKAGKLNYDDNYVYWNDSKYERKNGKIIYKGKSYIEGHPSLPWEKKAYNAEPSTKEIKRKKLYA